MVKAGRRGSAMHHAVVLEMAVVALTAAGGHMRALEAALRGYAAKEPALAEALKKAGLL